MREVLDEISWIKAVPGLHFIINQIISRLDDFGNFLPFFFQFFWTALFFRPQIIHVNNEPLSNRAAILVGKILRIPVICHVRGPNSGTALTRMFYKLPDHYIPVSHWISDSIGKIGVPGKKRSVVYDGIALDALNMDADGGKFRKDYSILENDFAVGLVGLMIPWKGQSIFLDAAKKLAGKIPGLRMLVIGGTPEGCTEYEQELRRRVVNENLSDTVIFTGHVDDMQPVYNGLDVVVSASTAPEPLGTVVIECMAMGRPLVAPNHGGAAEMADNNVNALLFKPGSAESLAQLIQKLFMNPELRTKLGRAARDKALGTFSVTQHVDEVQSVYEKVLTYDA